MFVSGLSLNSVSFTERHMFLFSLWPKAEKEVVTAPSATDCVKCADDIFSYGLTTPELNQIELLLLLLWQTFYYRQILY